MKASVIGPIVLYLLSTSVMAYEFIDQVDQNDRVLCIIRDKWGMSGAIGEALLVQY